VVIEDAAHAIGSLTPDGPVGNCAHSDTHVGLTQTVANPNSRASLQSLRRPITRRGRSVVKTGKTRGGGTATRSGGLQSAESARLRSSAGAAATRGARSCRKRSKRSAGIGRANR